MSEYWIEVKGHPRYRVSTMGRVKCINWKRTGKERICKLSVNGYGYLTVKIDGKKKLVHRLVLESFIPNPQNKPCIDHINTIRTDNRVENLRWVTYIENNNNPITRKRMSENAYCLGKFGKENPTSKPIIQLTIGGVFVKKWDCARDVDKELEISFQSISKCLRGKTKTAGGFKWVYASDYQRKSIYEIKPLF